MGLQFLSLKRSKTPCAEVLSTTCGMWNGRSHIAQKIHQNSPQKKLKPNNPRPHLPPKKKQKTKNIQNHHQAQNVTLPRTSPPQKNLVNTWVLPKQKKNIKQPKPNLRITGPNQTDYSCEALGWISSISTGRSFTKSFRCTNVTFGFGTTLWCHWPSCTSYFGTYSLCCVVLLGWGVGGLKDGSVEQID